MKVTKLNIPKKGDIHHYFIASDWHSDTLNIPTYKVLKQHSLLFPKGQRRLIINGDFLDCPHLMHRSDAYKNWIDRAKGIEDFFLPVSEVEFDWGNKILDELCQIFDEIIFVEGNHDWRYRDFSLSKKCPAAYKENFNYIKQLKFKERGIKVVYYNDWLDIGILSVTHGMFHGTTCKKKHYESCGGRDVLFGHVHHYSCQAFQVRGKTRYSRSLPAMCDLNPCYIKNRETNWDNGYGQFYIFDDGTYDFKVNLLAENNMITLNDGRFFEANKIIE